MMSLQAMRTLAVSWPKSQTRNRIDFNKVLLLSHHMPSEPEYPVIEMLPDYDPDLAMGVRIRAKNIISVIHSLVDVECKKLAVIYISLKAASEEEVFLHLSVESYGNFLQFLPKMLLPNTRVTVLNSDSGRNLFHSAVVSVRGVMLEMDRVPDNGQESFLSTYVRFLMCSPLTKEQLREKMTPGALLSFLYTLGMTDAEVVRTVGSYIQINKCRNNPHCPHFSRLRCEGCHVVHYCDTKCQKRDFPKHQLECPGMEQEERKEIHDGFYCREQLVRRLNREDLPSLEYFLQQIRLNVFKLFYPALEEVPGLQLLVAKQMTEIGLEEVFLGRQLKRFCEGIEMYQPGAIGVCELENEMVRLWGPLNLFSRLLKGDLQPVVNNQTKKTEVNGKKGKKIQVCKNKRKNGK